LVKPAVKAARKGGFFWCLGSNWLLWGKSLSEVRGRRVVFIFEKRKIYHEQHKQNRKLSV